MKKSNHYKTQYLIHPTTSIIFLLAIISGRFKPLFIYIIVAAIHELGHFSMAKVLKLPVKKVSVLPFGLFIQIDDLQYVEAKKELLVLIAGPLMYFPTRLLIGILYKESIISYFVFKEAMTACLSVLWFNLLPIWPLDGLQIIKNILHNLFPYKFTLKIITVISVVTTIIILALQKDYSQYVILFFLIISNYQFIKNSKKIWRQFLIYKTNKHFYKRTKIHNKKDLYKPYNNMSIQSGKVLTEQEMAFKLLQETINNKKNTLTSKYKKF